MTDPQTIVAVLEAHPDVDQVEVLPLAAGGAERTLAVVTVKGFATAAVLRESLVRDLGAAHTSVGVLVVDSIPQRDRVTDTEAVEAMVREAGEAVWYHAAGDETEADVAAMWAEALGTAEVSVLDAFLDLGGDSLAAIRVTAAVEQRFGVAFDLDDLLDATVRSLAAAIRERRSPVATTTD